METKDLEKLVIAEQEHLFEIAGRLQRRTEDEITLRYEKAVAGLFAYITKVKEIPTREAYEAQLEIAKEEKLKAIEDESVRTKLSQSFDKQKAKYDKIFTRELPQRLLAAMQGYFDFANVIRNNYASIEGAAAMGARVLRVPGSKHISLDDIETHNEIKNMALLLTDLVIYAELITPEEIVTEAREKLWACGYEQHMRSYWLRREKITAGKDKNELLNIGERAHNSIKDDASVNKAQEEVAGRNKDLGGMYG